VGVEGQSYRTGWTECSRKIRVGKYSKAVCHTKSNRSMGFRDLVWWKQIHLLDNHSPEVKME